MTFDFVQLDKVYLISHGQIRVRLIRKGGRFAVEKVHEGSILHRGTRFECQEYIHLKARHNPPGVFEAPV